MKKYVCITADTDDGDYVSEMSSITDKEEVYIKAVVKAIKKNDGTYETGDMGNSARENYGFLGEAFETFNNLCPHGEHGVHTIESVEIFHVVKKQTLI